METKLMRIPQWIGIVIILAFITTGASLTIFSPFYANGLINVVIPILILIFFKSEFFEKLKLSTLAIGRLLVVVTFLGFLPGNLLVQIIIWLLRINILEATLTDFKNKSYFNGVSGLVLTAASFILTGSWILAYSKSQYAYLCGYTPNHGQKIYREIFIQSGLRRQNRYPQSKMDSDYSNGHQYYFVFNIRYS